MVVCAGRNACSMGFATLTGFPLQHCSQVLLMYDPIRVAAVCLIEGLPAPQANHYNDHYSDNRGSCSPNLPDALVIACALVYAGKLEFLAPLAAAGVCLAVLFWTCTLPMDHPGPPGGLVAAVFVWAQNCVCRCFCITPVQGVPLCCMLASRQLQPSCCDCMLNVFCTCCFLSDGFHLSL